MGLSHVEHPALTSLRLESWKRIGRKNEEPLVPELYKRIGTRSENRAVPELYKECAFPQVATFSSTVPEVCSITVETEVAEEC